MARKQTIEAYINELREKLLQPDIDSESLIKRALLKRGLQPAEQAIINYECLRFRVEKGDIAQALQQYHTKKRHLLRHKQASFVVQMLGALIGAFVKRGDYVNLRTVLLEAEDLLLRPEVPTLVAVQIYNHLAKAHIRLNNHDMVAKYLEQANTLLNHFAPLQHQLREYAEILATFGVYEYLRYNFNLAIEYNENAFVIAKNIASHDNRWLANIIGNRGLYFLYTDKIEEAKAEYQIAYTLFKDVNDEHGLAENLNMQAVLYNHTQEYEKARICLEQALAIGERHIWNEVIINALLGLGRMYASAETIPGKPKAREYFHAAERLSHEQGLEEPGLYGELAEFYRQQQEYDKAYLYLQKSFEQQQKRWTDATTLLNELLHRSMVQAEHDNKQVLEQLRLRDAELEIERQRSSNVQLLKAMDDKSEAIRKLEELLGKEKKRHLLGNNADVLKLIERIHKLFYVQKDRTATEQKYLSAYSDVVQKLTECKPKLSTAEIIICVMTIHGLHTNQIADELTVSVRTVENQRMAVRKKLRIGKEYSFREALQKLFMSGK